MGRTRISKWNPNRTGLLLRCVYKDNPYLHQEWEQLHSYIADHIDLWHEPVEHQLTYVADINTYGDIGEDGVMKESKQEERNGRIDIRVPMSAWHEYQALVEEGKRQGVDVSELLSGFVSRFLKKAEKELSGTGVANGVKEAPPRSGKIKRERQIHGIGTGFRQQKLSLTARR